MLNIFFICGKAQAFTILDTTSFDPQPVKVEAKNNSVPIGTVIVWTKKDIPEGWLECNRQAINQDLYPDLFALMSNTPNYQGYFLRGLGGNSEKLGVEQGDAIRNIEESFSHGFDIDAKKNNSKSIGSFIYEKNKQFKDLSGLSWTNSSTSNWIPLSFDASRVVPHR